MARLVFQIIGQSCDFGEGRDQILHPSRQKRESLFVQGLSSDHLQQDVLRNIAVALVVVADVEGQETCNVSKLVLGGSFDQLVGEAA